MKKDAYYFSHDANAQDDPKIMVLIDQLGMEGYGIFWALIEKLRNEAHYRLPLNVTASFARRWGTSKEKVDTVIHKYGLFIVEDECFFSLRLKRSMDEKSEKARISANYRWGNATALQPNSDRIATDMRNNAIKGKKRKGKESKVFMPPSVDEMVNYFIENGYSETAARKAYELYNTNNWHDSYDNPVRSWKLKVQNNWFKEANKIPVAPVKKMVI